MYTRKIKREGDDEFSSQREWKADDAEQAAETQNESSDWSVTSDSEVDYWYG